MEMLLNNQKINVMEKLTYSEAYNKIIEAYFKDEIKPFNSEFCFCGTLCYNKSDWNISTYSRVHADFGNYTGVEYVKMERALLDALKMGEFLRYCNPWDSGYEDLLFAGMCAALDVLKEIHRSRGENVDE